MKDRCRDATRHAREEHIDIVLHEEHNKKMLHTQGMRLALSHMKAHNVYDWITSIIHKYYTPKTNTPCLLNRCKIKPHK